jgi:hypothetical protein
MLKKFNNFSEDLIIESVLNESIVYFSPRMRSQLDIINSDISKRMLELEGTDITGSDLTFIDADGDGNVTFITMPNAMKLLKARYPDADNVDLDVSGSKDLADIIYRNDSLATRYGNSQGDTGVYVKSRNTIKIGKLVNRLFKGSLTSSDIEKFVNDFKASTPSNTERIELISGESIRHWYNEENYYSRTGTLGNSCMANKPGKFFSIYAQNPNSCNLLIMTIGDKLVARALVWKLNSFNSLEIEDDIKPEYFLDRVYSNEDYQVEKMKRFASDKGWAIKTRNDGHSSETVTWKGKTYIDISMSVKVKKSNYDDTYPYMDTFMRYDHFSGLLWNDEKRKKGGHILRSTQGEYTKSIPRTKVYINKFKDFLKKSE